jgi:oligopeptidase B
MLPLLAGLAQAAVTANGPMEADVLLKILAPAGIVLLAGWLSQADARSAGFHAPVANVVPKAHALHGDVRIDNYAWLRDKTNPEVIAYLESENAYTEAVTQPSASLRESLYAEMLGRIKETDTNAPYREGTHWYYSRTEEGKQYPIYCRKRSSLDAPETVILDQNELSRGYGFFALGAMTVSPDESTLAYAADTNGSETFDLYVKNLGSGANYPDRIRDVDSVVWAMDNATLLYTTRDAAKRPHRLWRHRLGADPATDALLYEEKDELFALGAFRSKSRAYIFVQSSSSTSDEIRVLPALDPSAEPRILLARRPDVEYSVSHHGDAFYILTNLGGRNFRLVKAPVDDPAEERWTDVVPHREDVTLEGTEFFKSHFVLFERGKGLQRMRVTDLGTGAAHEIAFPEPVYAAFNGTNRVWDTDEFRFSYQSFITPLSVFDYNLRTRERILRKRQDVLGGYDPGGYVSERVYAAAADGTEVPVSLVYRAGARKNGAAPMHLTGYGAYGISAPVTFSSNRLSLLDRGVIFAVAHVRGGGDQGRDWKESGRMLRKKNTFTDFIACAEHLIARNYTAPDRLSIEGGSAGGLLVGAVTNMRPDLFTAVVAQVPFVDVLNTMLDAGLPLTVGEYLEWGNPNEKEYYDYIKSYCPYTNVRPQAYPNILVKVGLNDPRVSYWEGAKWVAKIRAMKTDDNITLLKVNMGAGHGGSSGRYDHLKEIAFDYAYILTQYGLGSQPQAPDQHWNQ